MAGISCLSKSMKSTLSEVLEEAGVDDAVLDQLKKVRACPSGAEIEFSGRGGKSDRPLTAYQQYIKGCMASGDKKPLATCAQGWKTSPLNPKNRR